MTPETYKRADLYERFRNRELFNACCTEGLRKAMLAHMEIDNKVAIWRNGRVELVCASEVLKDIDAA